MHDDEQTDILKRDALGRVTLKREKREALLNEFERSGLKGTAFARLVGINYGTFASWVQDRRHARGEYAHSSRTTAALLESKQVRFLQVAAASAVAAPLEPTVDHRALEVRLPGDVTLRVTDAGQMPWAVQLIQSLRASC